MKSIGNSNSNAHKHAGINHVNKFFFKFKFLWIMNNEEIMEISKTRDTQWVNHEDLNTSSLSRSRENRYMDNKTSYPSRPPKYLPKQINVSNQLSQKKNFFISQLHNLSVENLNLNLLIIKILLNIKIF